MTDDITRLNACQIVSLVQQRALSATEVLDAHIANIQACNVDVNALVTLCLDRARSEAAAVDSLSTAELLKLPLAGLPYAVKDTIQTQGLLTTFGSKLFADHVPDFDATHVSRARAAGAIVVGKSNTPEFASGAQTCNPVFGLTRNPLDLTRTVTGSSGGAAAALAAHMVPMADGSDLGGSLRAPASVCGVVGFRPTAGQVPRRDNPLPYNPLHVFGPMARSVEDIALFMSIFSGSDEYCPQSNCARTLDYTQSLEFDCAGVRLAWSTNPCGVKSDPAVVIA
ncbi:MAG: amidase family protein, partial [Pseudomonadota bacterium]